MKENEYAFAAWAFRSRKDGLLYLVNGVPKRGSDGDWILSPRQRPIGFPEDAFPKITPDSEPVRFELVARICPEECKD